MTSHSPASSPELPKLPSGMRASAHASDLIVFHAFDMEAYGRACYEAGSAAAAQAAKQVSAGWQPIETAPKDGTELLLWREDCGQFIGSYVSADSFPLEQKEIDELTEEELFTHDWFTQWPDARRLEGSELPTLWQNLAAAPSATSLAEAAEVRKYGSQYTPEQRAWCERYERETTFEPLMEDFEAGNETFLAAAKNSRDWFESWASDAFIRGCDRIPGESEALHEEITGEKHDAA